MESNPDMASIRSQFPILDRKIGEKPLIYFDNTATSQTPCRVVDAVVDMYENHKANVHRGVHTLSQEATARQESARLALKRYINARSIEEVIFTRGTTEAINLVAASYGERFKEGDEVILTVMEHHANIVPWQLLRDRKGIRLRVVDINDDGVLDIDQYKSFFNERTVFASFCHVSNVLGTVNPVKEMIDYAHERGVAVLIDGAQASPHLSIDVMDLDCDFYAFSSHKMYGPSGVGVLYGKREILDTMPPYQGGGEMIKHVSFEETTYADLPFKFEAGTPDFVDIAAFSEALAFIEDTGIDTIHEHEQQLLKYAEERLREFPAIKVYGNAPGKCAVISFNAEGVHPYDLGMLLDTMGIAVRTGHHCAQPLMERFNIPGTVRASFAVYNKKEEVDEFISALGKALKVFGL